MSHSKQHMSLKKLEELSFEDLYVEIPERTYPALREAFGELFSKLAIRKTSQAKGNNTKAVGIPIWAASHRFPSPHLRFTR